MQMSKYYQSLETQKRWLEQAQEREKEQGQDVPEES